MRLFNQAKKEGREEVVIFSGHPKRRDYILKYIKRNDKIHDEAHLLSCISDDEETPRHIHLQDAQAGSVGTPSTVSQYPPTPATGSPSGSIHSQSAQREPSPMRVHIPSPEYTPQYTPRSSGEWTAADLAPGFGQINNQLLAHSAASQNWPLMATTSSTFLLTPTHIQPVWSQPQQYNDTSREHQIEFTHAVLSADPADMGQLGVPDLDMDQILGDQVHSPQLKDGSFPAYFVTYCLYWLIYAGQDGPTAEEEGERCLNSALVAFLGMLTDAVSPAEECLGALAVVAVLFDCYGQQERLEELLSRCDGLTKPRYGEQNPLSMIIEFMGNMRTGASCDPHDIQRLEQVVADMRVIFPQSPGPVLTARYYLAWARLENELKRDSDRTEAFEPIRQYLEDLANQWELHFGGRRIESIMTAATLARATFFAGNGSEAERILSQSVMPRVRENFVEKHPYVWEAKHRHAYFLYRLAEKENNPSKLAHLQLGEQLLRQIVPARRHVLGESNPKSINSYQLLKATLRAQGRTREADKLSEWCQRELGQSGSR